MSDPTPTGPARGEPMIRFANATKTYKSTTRPALDQVSVDIHRGDFVFLIGPSGSGKSTFLRTLLKEENLTSGDVYLGGLHINALSDHKVPLLRQRIGYVFQDFRLLKKKNVYDNVAFALEVIGKSRSEIAQRVPETLRLVGLETKQHRMPHELSGGEQQRVAIARAVINRPLVLLADEPTGNLDPATGEEIMTLLARINRGGTTVVMSTHNAHAVDSMRRRVLEMSNGRLVRDDARGVYGLGS